MNSSCAWKGVPNLVLTHARLGDFERAHSVLSMLSDPPPGIQPLEPAVLEELTGRVARAERALKQAETAAPDRAPVLRAIAMGELGAYLRALRALRPLYDKDPKALDVGPLYVQLLVAARLDREALQEATRLLGPERGAETVARVREQLPQRTRELRAPKEPSAWWTPEAR